MKRFTDTNKWDDPWYRRLTLGSKLFWMYLCDNCDNAGIWKVDFELASFQLGETIGEDAIDKINNGKERLKYYDSKRLIMIKDFIGFQIGNLLLKDLSNLQVSSINLIHSYIKNKSFVEEDFGYTTGSLPVKNGYRSGIGKGKGKGKGKGTGDSKVLPNAKFEEIWKSYPRAIGKKAALRHFNASVKTNQDWLDINKALENYKNSEEVKKGMIKYGSTWFNEWQDWVSIEITAKSIKF